MTTFDDRERAFENRFVHDQDLNFRAQARRNREAAHWAGGLLGKSGAEETSYAEHILALAVEGGTEAVVARLAEDLAGAAHPVSAEEVRRHMDLELAKALQALKTE